VLWGRLRFWLPVGACWAAAVGALYLHPVFWALFTLLLGALIVWRVRGWSPDQ